MTTFAPIPPAQLLRRADLLAQGFSDNHIRRARREGALAVLLPGVYLPAIDWQQLDPAGRYRARLVAIVGGLTDDAVVSHWSAGVVHGFIDASDEKAPAHVTRAGPAKSRHGPGVQVHRGLLQPVEIVRLDGLAVTSAARTVVDCLLSLPAGLGAALTRRALARGSVTEFELRNQLSSQQRTPGVRHAGAVVLAILAERPFTGTSADGVPSGQPTGPAPTAL